MAKSVDVLVISDIHLGTYGCHAKELLEYLDSVAPKKIILNGDIIDMWQFRKNYFPEKHLTVIQKLIEFTTKGIPVYYLVGNHDDLLRRFIPITSGNFHLKNKIVLNIDGKSHWFFHGDVFDNSINCARWIAKLGGKGYDLLIRLNRSINYILKYFNKPPKSISKKIKDSVKVAVKFVSDFEDTAAKIAITKGYDYVVCGHIHKPQMKEIATNKGAVTYLNSGDWIENLTALEYYNGAWHIFKYNELEIAQRKEMLPEYQVSFSKTG